MTENQRQLAEYKEKLYNGIKNISLCELEKQLHNKDYPQIRGARKILKNCISCKLMSLRDREWC